MIDLIFMISMFRKENVTEFEVFGPLYAHACSSLQYGIGAENSPPVTGALRKEITHQVVEAGGPVRLITASAFGSSDVGSISVVVHLLPADLGIFIGEEPVGWSWYFTLPFAAMHCSF
jgi:hypothetical protein